LYIHSKALQAKSCLKGLLVFYSAQARFQQSYDLFMPSVRGEAEHAL